MNHYKKNLCRLIVCVALDSQALSPILTRRESCDFFKHPAKVHRGMKAALQGDLFNRPVCFLQFLTGRLNL